MFSFGSSFYGCKDAMTEANDGSIAEVVMNSVYFEIRKLRNILKRFMLSGSNLSHSLFHVHVLLHGISLLKHFVVSLPSQDSRTVTIFTRLFSK